jgi:hypothetical protein
MRIGERKLEACGERVESALWRSLFPNGGAATGVGAIPCATQRSHPRQNVRYGDQISLGVTAGAVAGSASCPLLLSPHDHKVASALVPSPCL